MKAVYKHDIDLEKLHVENASSMEFAQKVRQIPYRGYEVEDISDGRKIVIAKPGGKLPLGDNGRSISGERWDFFVFIHNPEENTLWQISHKEIFDDLHEKSRNDKAETIKILQALEKVYNGEEPDDVLKEVELANISGETPETLLKVYKWIWGQEDVNYPFGEGRGMSWKKLKDLLESLESK